LTISVVVGFNKKQSNTLFLSHVGNIMISSYVRSSMFSGDTVSNGSSSALEKEWFP